VTAVVGEDVPGTSSHLARRLRVSAPGEYHLQPRARLGRGRGAAPGRGVAAGLTSAGIPQDQAIAAVFIQRMFTTYLPPVWGWVTLAWMRRREYV